VAIVDEVSDRIADARESGRLLDASVIAVGDGVAYAIQARLTARRLASGERIVGWKLGYTSAAMRLAMGIDRANHGPLTDRMVTESPGIVGAGLLQPRVEPEIALVIGEDGRIHRRHLALEVVDSAWRDYQFTWAQNTADGSSACAAVVERRTDLPALPGGTRVRLSTSAGEAVDGMLTGDPSVDPPTGQEAVDGLAAELGLPRLPVGSVVLTGGLTPPLPLPPEGWAQAQLDLEDGRIVEVRVERRDT
jgi:2-keto-4-pentenoate hydratase